jgi:hypothetical protein
MISNDGGSADNFSQPFDKLRQARSSKRFAGVFQPLVNHPLRTNGMDIQMDSRNPFCKPGEPCSMIPTAG